jgi:hypothetical protein
VGDDAAGLVNAVFSDPRVTRDPDGSFRVHLPELERHVVRQLPDQLRRELDDVDDPGLRRVFPPASTDEGLATEYRELVGGELLAGRRNAVALMEATTDAETLDEEHLLGWLSTVNDLRLILGTRLGVTEDPQDDDDLPDEDPRAQASALYHYLGFLEEQIVDALTGSMPG